MSRLLDLYTDRAEHYPELTHGQEDRLAWLSNELFDVTTYDDDMSYRFGKAIVDVMRAILKRVTFEYIKTSEPHYIQFLLVANLLDKHKLIDWGGSIRGCWFDLDNTKIIKNEDEMKYLLYDFIKEVDL